MKPKPVATSLECSLCGQPWGDHPAKPKKKDCIALLRSKLTPAAVYTLGAGGGTVTDINLTRTGSTQGLTFHNTTPWVKRDNDEPPEAVPA